jgi:peptidyl-prolyl cis-trans isomerase C
MGCTIRSALAGQYRVPVTVNGVAIAHDAIAREAQNHPAPSPVQAWTGAARALAIRELLLQEAHRLGLRPQPLVDEGGRKETGEEALVRALITREVATPAPDEDSCRRYYEKNRARFRSPDICEASHILIAARRDQPAAFAAARQHALRLLAELRDEPERFAELAVVYSDCPSAASGGHLGQLTPGSTTPEFAAALALLGAGELSAEPVETRYGFHVIRLHRRVVGEVLPFEAVRERIAGYLVARSRWLATAQYIARLAGRAEIAGVELATPEGLRVH